MLLIILSKPLYKFALKNACKFKKNLTKNDFLAVDFELKLHAFSYGMQQTIQDK